MDSPEKSFRATFGRLSLDFHAEVFLANRVSCWNGCHDGCWFLQTTKKSAMMADPWMLSQYALLLDCLSLVASMDRWMGWLSMANASMDPPLCEISCAPLRITKKLRWGRKAVQRLQRFGHQIPKEKKLTSREFDFTRLRIFTCSSQTKQTQLQFPEDGPRQF